MIEVLLNSMNNQGGDGTIRVRHLLGASIPVGPITGIITDPAGGVIPLNFDSNTTFLAALPLNVQGAIIYGDYTVNLSYEGEGFEGVFPLCDRRADDYQLTAEVQCLLGIAEIKDDGKYPSGATINRTFRIRRAAVMSFDEESRDQLYDTVNRPRHRIEVAYGGVDYTFDVSGEAEWIANDDANLQFVEQFQTSSITKLADCRRSLCVAADCLDRFVQTKINAAVSCNSGLNPIDMVAVTRAQLLFSRLQVAIECFDVVGAGAIYTDLEKVIGKCVCSDCGDNRVVRIGYDVAIGLSTRTPISRLLQGGTSSRVQETTPGSFIISNLPELDELAGKTVRRSNGLVDLNLAQNAWTAATLLNTFRNGFGINSSLVNYRQVNSLGGKVQIQGFIETGTPIYTDGAIVTETPFPESYRVSRNGIPEDSFPFVLWGSNRNVVGSAVLMANGHLMLRTNTADPGGNPALENHTFWFIMEYDPDNAFTFNLQNGL